MYVQKFIHSKVYNGTNSISLYEQNKFLAKFSITKLIYIKVYSCTFWTFWNVNDDCRLLLKITMYICGEMGQCTGWVAKGKLQPWGEPRGAVQHWRGTGLDKHSCSLQAIVQESYSISYLFNILFTVLYTKRHMFLVQVKYKPQQRCTLCAYSGTVITDSNMTQFIYGVKKNMVFQ